VYEPTSAVTTTSGSSMSRFNMTNRGMVISPESSSTYYATEFGTSVSWVHDINGDSRDELIIGAGAVPFNSEVAHPRTLDGIRARCSPDASRLSDTEHVCSIGREWARDTHRPSLTLTHAHPHTHSPFPLDRRRAGRYLSLARELVRMWALRCVALHRVASHYVALRCVRHQATHQRCAATKPASPLHRWCVVRCRVSTRFLLCDTLASHMR
jgi:hypothetical protein